MSNTYPRLSNSLASGLIWDGFAVYCIEINSKRSTYTKIDMFCSGFNGRLLPSIVMFS